MKTGTAQSAVKAAGGEIYALGGGELAGCMAERGTLGLGRLAGTEHRQCNIAQRDSPRRRGVEVTQDGSLDAGHEPSTSVRATQVEAIQLRTPVGAEYAEASVSRLKF
jgi:hypothetical protein